MAFSAPAETKVDSVPSTDTVEETDAGDTCDTGTELDDLLAMPEPDKIRTPVQPKNKKKKR
jgi:hypothetical protein